MLNSVQLCHRENKCLPSSEGLDKKQSELLISYVQSKDNMTLVATIYTQTLMNTKHTNVSKT